MGVNSDIHSKINRRCIAFENRALRRLSGSQTEEATREWGAS
jgi:hypothetical protein